MDAIVVAIAKSFEVLARRTHDAAELSEQIVLLYPDADISEIRRGALFATTSPTIDPETVTRVYDVAIRLKRFTPPG